MKSNFKFIFAGQYGGIGASLFHMEYSITLRKIIEENMKGLYFKNVKEFYIALRVSGDVVDFKGDGPERLRYMSKHGYISIDFVIPMCKWRQQPRDAIKENFCKGVSECFYLMVKRAEKFDEFIDKQKFIDDFEKSMQEFQDTVSVSVPERFEATENNRCAVL
jgi:hypothetical protein